jgi:hypothetical protein
MNSLLKKGLVAIILEASTLSFPGLGNSYPFPGYQENPQEKQASNEERRGFTSLDLGFMGLTTACAYYFIKKKFIKNSAE